jgi:hypothetical protein
MDETASATKQVIPRLKKRIAQYKELDNIKNSFNK